MDVGDIVSIDFLKQEGYRLLYPNIWDFEKGLPDMCVYHSKEKQLDVKILKISYLPEFYKIELKVSTKTFIDALRVSLSDRL